MMYRHPGRWKVCLRASIGSRQLGYIIDKIIVFQDIDFVNIRRNEVKDKILLSAVKSQMNGKGGDPCIYTSESRSQRAAMVLKNVKIRFRISF